MIEDTMTLLSLLGRIMRYFLLRPETLFLLCISLALWSYFFHTDEVKTIVKSSRDAVKMVKGKVAEMMHNERFGGLDVPDAEFAKTWELKSHNVAVYSIQGRRDHMEDRYDVLADVVNKTHPSIFGIFDGHGGEAAADYAKAHLPEALRQQLLTYERERERDREKDKEKNEKKEGVSYPSILEQQILMLDRAMLEKLSATYNEAGTTCLVALLSDKELTVANVGDSRGVLCDKDGNAIPLSHDHKPYQLKERKRIKKAGAMMAVGQKREPVGPRCTIVHHLHLTTSRGGFISFNGSWRVQGILAMSRSLGDYTLKNLNVVIPDPDILSFDLNKLQPEFMILASDGLWDTFSNEEAVRFVRERLDEPHFGAKSIVLQSYYRGCPDNITVMVVKFKGKTAER
ncbi:protein phosphatase, Mg2+/Mn2+ dependent, 1Lb isoform X1 [Syngnathoides biaculeatus]|uniref:protein phosphatase, Mg2+/Mn2+ dependent, 1Lb isoform X1 n=1 Tax=Syngnathoides biaculeatus TaxID=300417 RepID=UPI002ADD87D1|nr:protein phosphatase, Mg2+/Mn2+ dependent, 1Lb isoform X1 [Syngnathoides biaculeatus]